MKIIIEYNEVVFRDSGVGRVGVLDVNRAIRQRSVAERVIDPADVAHLQAIASAERRPAILAAEELVRYADIQPRIFAEVADLADA